MNHEYDCVSAHPCTYVSVCVCVCLGERKMDTLDLFSWQTEAMNHFVDMDPMLTGTVFLNKTYISSQKVDSRFINIVNKPEGGN